jgi:hypothetical protein
VRQALAKLKVKNFSLDREYVELIAEELNVKKVVEDKNIEGEIELDTNITPALKAEGEYREFVRELMDKRKKFGLNPGDKMAMSISDIYKKYKIMPNLQMHMFRVAAVASLICDNFEGELNKKEIITGALLHDMGNILKFDLSKFPEFTKPEGQEYWESVKREHKNKYGENEHIATNKIVEEIKVSETVVEFINSISFLGAPKSAEENNFNHKIMEYADDRVSPGGVVGLDERLMDLRKRYAYKPGKTEHRDAFEGAMHKIEKQIFAKCKIKPEDINDESVKNIIEELKNFEI